MIGRTASALAVIAIGLAGCAGKASYPDKGVDPEFSFPVTSNATPYSQCLESLADAEGSNLPIFAVGEVPDKTGQIDFDQGGRALTQGVAEMVMSAFSKTDKVNMVERLDLRIPLAEVKLAEQGRLDRRVEDYGRLPASDFIITGALTELNYNIVSDGARAFISGIGAGVRTVVVNVALDLRVVDSRNFAVRYVSSLQKQIFGVEVEGNIFRFFGDTLIEFNGGRIRNEPMQLGVRSVAEMAVYQIMTDFLGLDGEERCAPVETGHMAEELQHIAAGSKSEDDGSESNHKR